MSRSARVDRFYGPALSEAEQKLLPHARRIEGLDEEIAVFRVRLRTLLASEAEDFALLHDGLATLARTLAIRHRISPQSANDLAERMAAVLRSIGDQILPPE